MTRFVALIGMMAAATLAGAQEEPVQPQPPPPTRPQPPQPQPPAPARFPQPPPPQSPVPSSAPDEEARKATEEHVEILRRLLIEKLTPFNAYEPRAAGGGPPRGGAAPTFLQQQLAAEDSALAKADSFSARISQPPPAVEGVYMPGVGVIFSATMRLSLVPLPQPAAPAAKPSSDWERAQKTLRGTADDPAPEPPSIWGSLKMLLAENGKNFTKLDENETITVCLTFRGPVPKPQPPQPAPPRNAKRAEESANYESLGDLLQRKNEWQESGNAYRRALESNDDPARQVRLYDKVASALDRAGDRDGANAARFFAQQRRTDYETLRAASLTKEPVVPARLTLTVRKKWLEEVGAGRMSVEEFRNKTKDEYRTGW